MIFCNINITVRSLSDDIYSVNTKNASAAKTKSYKTVFTNTVLISYSKPALSSILTLPNRYADLSKGRKCVQCL